MVYGVRSCELELTVPRMGEINSACLWLDGVLVGAVSGVFYYPDNSQEAQYLPLPSDEKALQSAHLTAILTQNMDAYALSLSAGKLWPLVWDGKILSLGIPKQFDTSAYLYQNEQGIESIWIPEQV